MRWIAATCTLSLAAGKTMMNCAPVAAVVSAKAPLASVTALTSSLGSEGGAVAPLTSVPPTTTIAPGTGFTPGAGEPFGKTDQPTPPPLTPAVYEERS